MLNFIKVVLIDNLIKKKRQIKTFKFIFIVLINKKKIEIFYFSNFNLK